jgi:hypothetical protein
MPHGIAILSIILILNIIVGCANRVEVPNQAYGMAKGAAVAGKLTGKVMKGPTTPVGRPDMPSPSEPAVNVKLVIMTPAGQEAGSIVTNKQGVYSISLPPGTYRVETTSLTGIEFTRDLPATVVITEGRETRLDIHIDTGMR